MQPSLLNNWWQHSSLSNRLLLIIGSILLLIGTLLLYITIQTASASYRQELNDQLKDELSAFAPILVEHAVIGDYASIQQLLDGWVTRKDLILATWTDYNGKMVTARDNSILKAPPAWFTAWVGIPAAEASTPLKLGQQSYGKLTMVLTPTPKINRVWKIFIYQLGILLTGTLLIMGMTVLLLRKGLKPLHTLAADAARFGQGDYSVRISPVSIPEILPSINSFNQMAQEIQTMVAQAQLSHADLHESESRWRFALEGAGDGVWDWQVQTGELQLSRRWKEMLGHHEEEIGNKLDEWIKRIHKDDLARAMEGIHSYVNGKHVNSANEYRMECKNGSHIWILTRGMVVSRDENGKPLRIIGTNTDITSRKADEETIQHQANFDPLTQLPNRRLFHDRLEQEIKKSERSDLPIALMLIDLDHFKDVNDTLGHDMGDILLIEVARRLKNCVRTVDTVARLGGDEFTIILGEQYDPGITEAIAEEILHRLSEPFHLHENISYITASIGITLYPSDSLYIEALLKNADQAMYAAKHLGRNRYSYFTPSMQKNAQTRMMLTRDLRTALANDQFLVYFQPIVSLKGEELTKAEALIRWQHPERGLVSPAEFIPIAEETGMIVEIGDWVFRQAAKHSARWRAAHHEKFQISVNVSPVQFHNQGINYQTWFDHLKELGLQGQSIVVEITEGLLLDAHSAIISQLLAFRDAGIGVSIDDFGTGYSSLSYLKKFDIDYLKIDQSFVRNLTDGSDDLILCEAIIVMAHKLGLRVIAEGVETAEQSDLLKTAGCDFAQGYLYSRPLPTEEFDRFLNHGASCKTLHQAKHT